VLQFQAGDPKALAELIMRHADRLVNFAYRLTGDFETGKEIAREVFLWVAASSGINERQTPFALWSYGVARDFAQNALDARRRHPNPYRIRPEDWNTDLLESLEGRAQKAPKGMEQQEADRIKEPLEEALVGLDLNWRAALTMKEYDRMSYEDIAEGLGVTSGAVEAWIRLSRELIAAALHEKGVL
jgi:RNA polymerase sigma-70 factor (ECF subfamily)